jgi:dihydroorotate dehydrogenase (NAD+) catalytic subunit
VAVEVNLSCPNMSGHGIFAHDADVSAEVVAAVVGQTSLPVWAKLSPNTDRLVPIAARVREAGADAVTLVNTVLGMALDPDTGRPALGNGGGGLSGRAIHPVAVRAVHDVRAAHPDLPIVGVGGVADGWSAAELIMAGADAVQVGTATFADPAAPFRVAADLEAWLRAHGHRSIGSIRGLAHR